MLKIIHSIYSPVNVNVDNLRENEVWKLLGPMDAVDVTDERKVFEKQDLDFIDGFVAAFQRVRANNITKNDV